MFLSNLATQQLVAGWTVKELVCKVGQIALTKYEGASPVSGFHIVAELVGMDLLQTKFYRDTLTLEMIVLKCPIFWSALYRYPVTSRKTLHCYGNINNRKLPYGNSNYNLSKTKTYVWRSTA